MTAAPPAGGWHELNQRELAAALGSVRASLERHVTRRRGGPPATADVAPAAREPVASESSALDQLAAAFRLSPFERELLLLCAGVELDSELAALCAAAQGDPQRPYPTLSLALAALPGAHWSAITPAGPLRHWRMIDVGVGYALTTSPLRIDERVLHFLTGVAGLDERLAGVVRPLGGAVDLAPSHRAIAERMAALWTQEAGGAGPPVIQLCGAGVVDTRAVAVAAGELVGVKLCVVAAETIPSSPGETESLARLWEREAVLTGSALLLEMGALEGADGARAAGALRFIERGHGALIVATPERRPFGQRTVVTFDVGKPSPAEQRAAWRAVLGESADRLNGHVEQLVSQFNLGTAAIRTAWAESAARTDDTRPAELGRTLWEACRGQARPRLDDLAQRIESGAAWDDLVLPDAQRRILRDVSAHVRQRSTVYERWGFGRQGSRGLGISALFAGASGTGKTMAAEVLGHELSLDVYRIDLSSVVSKYIGETEKNLRRIFDAAEEGGAILLFDEADALFGKRSEVKDSHDRYANIEVSYLLQRMECYRGLAILTTNLKSALDTAFLRRIRFVVQFPFPDAAQRAEIWRRAFPADTPTDGVDVERLARLNVAGGNIRNIALNAAFGAADAGEPVRMTHLLRAARSEYAKLEKALTEVETMEWA